MVESANEDKGQPPKEESPRFSETETVPRTTNNIGIASRPSLAIITESPEMIVCAQKPVTASAKEVLNKLEEFTMEYELDCRGWCWMPVVFRIFAVRITDLSIPSGTQVFQSKSSLPSSCDTSPMYHCVISFALKKEASYCVDTEFLKLQPGVFSNDWCANNDKVDVYTTEETKKVHLGYILKKVTCCGYEWQIRAPNNDIRYTVKNSNSTLSICCRCPCAPCKKVTFSIKGTDKIKAEPFIAKVRIT